MRIWIRTLVYKEILTGATINWSKEIKVFFSVEQEIESLKKSGHSLLVGSIFGRIPFTDANGNKGLFPQDDNKNHWRDYPLRVLRALLDSGIDFKVIGDKEELEFLKKNIPPLYDKVVLHIIWKGKKNGNKEN